MILKRIAKALLPKRIKRFISEVNKKKRIKSISNTLINTDNPDYQYYGRLITEENELKVYYGEWTSKWKKWKPNIYYDDPCYYAEFKTLVDGGGETIIF